jgi:bacteriorhodopsin
MAGTDSRGRNRRTFRGSSSEWFAGYAAICLVLSIIAATTADYTYAFWTLGLAAALAALSIYRWKRPDQED